MPLAVLRPDYSPPDTLAAWEKRHIDPLLDRYSHIGIIDKDVTVPDEFYETPKKCLDADIINFDVKPSSITFYIWEKLTYWTRLEEQHRGCAVIYSTAFIKKLGGWPLVETPDTWLWQRSRFTVNTGIVVVHNQSFDWSHSIQNQIRDGKSRAELDYPFWKTVLHSVFRVRPLVLYSYLREKLK